MVETNSSVAGSVTQHCVNGQNIGLGFGQTTTMQRVSVSVFYEACESDASTCR